MTQTNEPVLWRVFGSLPMPVIFFVVFVVPAGVIYWLFGAQGIAAFVLGSVIVYILTPAP